MNAYELADELQDLHGLYCEDAANMLRQQADRIERKRELIREQTALLVKQNNRIVELEKLCRDLAWANEALTPYYTAPQIKELSDEEILNLYKETEADNGGIREFARAILKKASEK